MTPYQNRLSEVTLRLAGDLKIRNRAQATIDAYTYHVQRFADFTKKPLDRATPEDVRNFQLQKAIKKSAAKAGITKRVHPHVLRHSYATELSRLALNNRQSMARLLFQSAWSSLRHTIRSEQDYDPAAIMVLHTWNQRMESRNSFSRFRVGPFAA